jgi:hypothetical protein
VRHDAYQIDPAAQRRLFASRARVGTPEDAAQHHSMPERGLSAAGAGTADRFLRLLFLVQALADADRRSPWTSGRSAPARFASESGDVAVPDQSLAAGLCKSGARNSRTSADPSSTWVRTTFGRPPARRSPARC